MLKCVILLTSFFLVSIFCFLLFDNVYVHAVFLANLYTNLFVYCVIKVQIAFDDYIAKFPIFLTSLHLNLTINYPKG